jgi:hypothetical protein
MALRQAALGLALASLLSCATAVPAPSGLPPEGPLAIQKISVDPKELKLAPTGSTSIRFELTQPAQQVSVEIQDEVGKPVRTLQLHTQPAGAVSVAWDGRDAAGAVVPSGVYLYGISATDSAGVTAVAETAVPGGNEVLAQQFTLDPETGTMRYLLPQASRVRLRVGLRGLPLLRTLYDWTPTAAGTHEVEWNGFDGTGKVRLRDNPALDVNLSAFALPGNAILVTANEPAANPPTGVRPGVPRDAYRHAQHALEVCHEPRLRIELPDARAKAQGGLPLVSGTVPVRMTLDPDDAGHLVDVRFEVMLFIDTVLLAEVEEGSNPFTYQLDTRALSPGAHLFTVNVLSWDDHAGTATIQFERRATGKAHGE